MIQLLIDNPLLLLFLVAGLGYPLGQLRVRGVNLGVAAVLFVGLAVGALNPDLKLPEIVYSLGLVLFVYTVGLTSGPGFFASLNRRGLRYNLLVLGMILVAAGAAFLLHGLLALPATFTAGIFAGSLTNTPALAGVLEYVKAYAPPEALDQMLAEPVIGYSISYPMGVVAMIVAIALAQRWWRVDYEAEARALPEFNLNRRLHTRTIQVTRQPEDGDTISRLINVHEWEVVFARMRRDGELMLVTGEASPQPGDQLSVVGPVEELDRVTEHFGFANDQRLDFDRSEMDYRRIFVSNPEVAGRRVRELELQSRYGAVITRVRRGDFELVPRGDTLLELGDQLRVLTQRQRLDDVRRLFGDSYRALSEIDILSFSFGICLGLLLGSVPVPLPGGVVFKLGFAGGPLIVALVLGRLSRTGPMIWSLPYSANLTLRQVGLVLFLAGVGTRSGYAFVSTLAQGNGLQLFLAGAAITTVAALGTLWIGYRLMKKPLGILVGMLSALQTQPAVLGFSLEQTRNELPNIGYATVYPVAMVAKILMAQLLLSMLL